LALDGNAIVGLRFANPTYDRRSLEWVMEKHREIAFETDICEHLAAHGWLYDPDASRYYDRARALYPLDLIAWVQETQPEAWEALAKRHGPTAETALLDRVRQQLDARGTLDLLRHGVEVLGPKKPIRLAQFKPALGMNAALEARYAANRLRVLRQVRYSLHNENCIDLVLVLNGLPVATAELKTDFTQSVEDAVDQYRFDRQPKPKGQPGAEPLLSFPSGALVHFAIGSSRVRMTTRLQGPDTVFLPFDRGDSGGAGNPVNPDGHGTAYLWETVWQRDSWLEVLGRYLIARRDKKKQIAALIFPRYHQLDATRALVAAVLAEGAGGVYLIQHSAGSGKTNTIAWTAHFFADLHDAEDRKVFDTVLVVSDRTVLDSQLQEAIFDFERTAGVVAAIGSKEGSKSGALAQALAAGKKIVVCTVQTFPFALEEVRQLAATQGKRFAVIADEAHSSQSGESAARLREVLSPEEIAELADGGEVGIDDLLAAQMAARARTGYRESGITYVALTATPKAKTLELFGRRPDPARAAGPDNLPGAFHVYSMRQAIEEGFILDVLKNYTPYTLAFRLATEGREMDEREVERAAALKGLMRWVRLHPYNIAQKVQIVVEHFRAVVAPLLDGQAKGMVVVGSRLEAVRWQLAMRQYIAEQGYPLGVLAAFSGEVTDRESAPDPVSERSALLNPDLHGRDIRDAFATGEYRLLLVANKFQTGFDQPLLCGMYVDKRLAGVQAVQTLSRLNRAHPGKDTTYILDFVNDPDEVLAAFKPYYETAELAGVTDPNLVFDLKAQLDASGHYDEHEVERVVAAELDPSATQKELAAAVWPVADRLLKQFAAAKRALAAAQATRDAPAEQSARDTLNALLLFKRNLGAYLRVYSFLSQVFDYGTAAVEKRAIFYRRLLPLLDYGREREGLDLSKVTLTHHALRNRGRRDLPLGVQEQDEDYRLSPMAETGNGELRDPEKARLAEIVAAVNDLFEGELSDDDKLVYVNEVLKTKLLESGILIQQAASNSREQFADSPNLEEALIDAVIEALDAHTAMSRQALDSDNVRAGLKRILLGPGQLWEALRARAERPSP
jgi:type I restriction enzyme, R subunit